MPPAPRERSCEEEEAEEEEVKVRCWRGDAIVTFVCLVLKLLLLRESSPPDCNALDLGEAVENMTYQMLRPRAIARIYCRPHDYCRSKTALARLPMARAYVSTMRTILPKESGPANWIFVNHLRSLLQPCDDSKGSPGRARFCFAGEHVLFY
jgi:hypothetical protein